MTTTTIRHRPRRVAAGGTSEHQLTMHAARIELASILRCDPLALPEVFYGTRPRALKVGIYFDILARYPAADAQRLRDWLGRYTSTRVYLRRIVLGCHRHDLDGNNAGAIEEQSRKRARRRFQLLDAERAQRQPANAEARHAAI